MGLYSGGLILGGEFVLVSRMAYIRGSLVSRGAYIRDFTVYYIDFRICYRNSYWLLFMSINQYGSEFKKETFTSGNFLRKNSGNPEITKKSNENPGITKQIPRIRYSDHPS